MLRSKHILLFIVLLFVGAQCVASQAVVLDSVVVDTIETVVPIDTINVVDSVELADAEFEAWIEKYAKVSNSDQSDSSDLTNDSTPSNKKQDFADLVSEGEEAREQEKNALISSVMASFKNKMRGEELGNMNSVDSCSKAGFIDTLSHVVTLNEELQDGEEVVSLAERLKKLSVDSVLEGMIAADSLLAEIVVDTTMLGVNPLFMDWVLGGVEQEKGNSEYGVWSDDSIVVEVRRGVKDYVRATAPELYTYHKSDLPSISELQISRITQADKKGLLLNLDSLNRSKTSQLKVDLPEMSKWSKGAKFQVHASQNYISSNWYKGGESNLAMTMYAMGYFNYDNRKGLQWDNKAEWKLGLYGMASDSLRWLRVNEDLLRLNSKLGYKAFKNFYYTAEWDFQTSLFNTYKSNTYIRSSGPFSPIRMSLSLGMDYKYKSIVSVFVSPLSYKLVYVADMRCKEGVLPEEDIAHQVGITDGTRRSNQLGALVRTDFDYDFNESIGMEVHFSFFGNYVGKIKGVEVGCEVIGNFKINRFLSAKVSLYPRYDSTTVPADGGKPKMQFYELISLGFNYKL